MSAVRLQPPLGDSLRAVLDVLDGSIRERELRLGGGSALAALWKHRFSTDIDLVCAPDVFARAFDPDGRLRIKDRLRMQRDMLGGISAIRVSPGLVGWKTNTGPVSIVPSRLPDSPELWSAHTVEDTGVRLASVGAILQGKLKGRLLAKGFAADRDGYDLAVALLQTPAEARSALAAASDTPDEILSAIQDAAGHAGVGRRVLKPAYKAITADPWGAALRILEEGLELSDFELAERRSTEPSADVPDL